VSVPVSAASNWDRSNWGQAKDVMKNEEFGLLVGGCLERLTFQGHRLSGLLKPFIAHCCLSDEGGSQNHPPGLYRRPGTGNGTQPRVLTHKR